MSDAKSQGAQCWICPQCHDDKHHTPGDEQCLRGQVENLKAANSDLQQWFDDARDEAERLRVQLSDMTGCACDAESLCKYHAMTTASGRSIVLRKQAEAIDKHLEYVWSHIGDRTINLNEAGILESFRELEQRLRQQAEEADGKKL